MLDEGGDAPAIALLRAARADRAPEGAKARAMAALGLDALRAPAVGASRSAPRAAASKRVARPALFQSVLAPSGRQDGFLGTGRLGTAAFVMAQAAIVALFLAAQPRRMPEPAAAPKEPGGVDVGLFAPPASKPVPSPVAAAPAQKAEEPRAMTPRPSRRPEAPEQADTGEGHAAAVEQTRPAEIVEALAPDLPAKPEVQATAPAVVEMAPSLPVRLVRTAGRYPTYTREALAARVEGTVQVKCVVGTDGALSSCRILKSVPHMDEAVLGAMATWRFEPVVSGGRPIAVNQVFTLRLVLPK
jgi:TonB family protein